VRDQELFSEITFKAAGDARQQGGLRLAQHSLRFAQGDSVVGITTRPFNAPFRRDHLAKPSIGHRVREQIRGKLRMYH
jgi:hypothetical protein